MGQGFYTAIVFGAIGDDAEKFIGPYADGSLGVDDMWTSWGWGSGGGKVFRGRYRGQLKTSYESKAPWVGFVVADNDGNISTGFNGKAADAEGRFPCLGGIFNYRSCRLSDLESLLEEIAPGRIAECRAMWAELQSELRMLGVDMPDGELLFVNDYD